MIPTFLAEPKKMKMLIEKQIMNKNYSKNLNIHQFYQKLYIHYMLEALTKQMYKPLGIM
jgi:Holliday junction resolvasome RuvABC endonuclease subunit